MEIWGEMEENDYKSLSLSLLRSILGSEFGVTGYRLWGGVFGLWARLG